MTPTSESRCALDRPEVRAEPVRAGLATAAIHGEWNRSARGETA